MRTPDFIVLGQGKAGTSLIYRELNALGNIGLSQPKELHYFSARYEKGFDWYKSHFAHIGEEADLVGEVSPSYLQEDALIRIAERLGKKTKVIFVLRHPVSHAYSRYLQNICATRRGAPFHVFASAMDGRLQGLFRAIRTCYELFGEENVLPLWFEEDIQSDDRRYLSKILAFLGQPAPPPRTVDVPARVNGGVMPHFILTGTDDLEIRHEGKRFIVPAGRLVFCGQERNSRIIAKPSGAQIRNAMVQQSRWTSDVSEQEFGALHRKYVRYFMRRLVKNFDYDMDRWEGHERRLAYTPAPPPKRFDIASKPNAKRVVADG